MKISTFSHSQFSQAYPNGIEWHYWTYARNLILVRILRPLISSNDVILDIGAGRGLTVAWLIQQKLNAYGVEIGKPSIMHKARKKMFLHIEATALPLSFRKKVKVIMLLDVLEHIKEPKGFLNRCKIAFPNAQYLVVTVPARQEIWSNYDTHYGHYYRYSIPTVSNLVSEAGYVLHEARYFFHSLYLPAMLFKLLKKDRPIYLYPPKYPILHKFLARMFFIEFLSIPKKLYGTSLLAIGISK